MPPTRVGAIVGYTAIACAVTWLAVAPLVLAGLGLTSASPPSWLHALGAVGPAAGALVMTWRSHGRPGLRALGDRVKNPGRIRGVWWWLAWSPLALAVAALLVVAPFAGLASVDARSVSAAIGVSIAYGVGEEIGWRGFLLPRLQAHMTAIRAAGWVFAIWVVWHLPMFTYRLPTGLLAIGWLVGLYFGSVWLTVLHNGTRGSVLACIVWHSAYNIASTVGADLSPVVPALVTMLVVVGTIVAVRRVGLAELCSGLRYAVGQ